MLLKLDHIIAQSGLSFSGSEGVLLSFLFHGLFDDLEDPESTASEPQQGITVQMFECFVEYFHRHSYTFVSPNEVAHGLDSNGKYVLVTFDDGYFSNAKALPVLERHGIPAALFVSTDHVLQGKAFWWDVVERESLKRRMSQRQVNQVHESLKRLRTPDAEAFVQAEFGPRALRPLGDRDRPFTLPELRDIAKHPLISLGNHTSNHDILTNYTLRKYARRLRVRKRSSVDHRESAGLYRLSERRNFRCDTRSCAKRRYAVWVERESGAQPASDRAGITGSDEVEAICVDGRFRHRAAMPCQPLAVFAVSRWPLGEEKRRSSLFASKQPEPPATIFQTPKSLQRKISTINTHAFATDAKKIPRAGLALQHRSISGTGRADSLRC